MRKIFWILLAVFILIMVFFIGLTPYGGYQHYQELKNQSLYEMNPDEQKVEKTPYPVLSLPFSREDMADSLVPMGETIAHPEPQNPGGHQGIDFEWDNSSQDHSAIRMLASMDGIVYAIVPGWDGYFSEFSIKNGSWGVDLTLSYVNPDIKVGQSIRRGDFIGYPSSHNTAELRAKYSNSRMTHWQFGYASSEPGIVEIRLCPMNYFDNASRQLIEEIWANVPNDDMFKSQFPYICSGYYIGRNE